MSTSRRDVALVTGAGAGIGRACARALAADGFVVAVNDAGEAACARTVDLIRSGGCRAEAFPFDVSDEAAWHSAAREIWSVLGPVTALVHNAAVKDQGRRSCVGTAFPDEPHPRTRGMPRMMQPGARYV
jgi:NAD(P)-dependent dehydrogenase (short-subunit alcohol dehydrogenase family)